MKKIIALAFTLSVILISCGKDNLLLPQDEIPAWLKTRIAEDEAKIESDSMSGLDLGAWMRYKFEGEYYFEYYNPIMSSLPPVFAYDGTALHAQHAQHPATPTRPGLTAERRSLPKTRTLRQRAGCNCARQ